ncbi:hypothetical protein ACFVH6_06915 [Spirillospora sp. NPDC127200]
MTRRTDETVAHVRRVMGPGDPAAEGRVRLPDEAEARRVLAQIMDEDRRGGAVTGAGTRRRRWTIVLAAALSISAVGAAADAAGVIPTGVIKALGSQSDPDSVWGEVDTGRARKLIAARGPDGSLVDWWTAPGRSGGECAYLRLTAPGRDGRRTEDGSLECGSAVVPKPGEALTARYGAMVKERMGVYGRAAAPDDPYAGFAHAELTALDAQGRTLATTRVYEGGL